MKPACALMLSVLILPGCVARSVPSTTPCSEAAGSSESMGGEPAESVLASQDARPPSTSPDARGVQIWKEFVAEIRAGAWPNDRFSPYPGNEGMVDQNRIWLREFRSDTWKLEQFEGLPRIYRVGQNVHFLLPWKTPDGERAEYLFTLLDEGTTWGFRVLEMLQLPLYEVPVLPARSFPKLDKNSLDWRRAEELLTRDVFFWKSFAASHGAEKAFSFFKDGNGYRMQVQTWLPYFPPHVAFILFLCWKESDMWGNDLVLEVLDEAHAVVRFDNAVYFSIYDKALHLRSQMSREDYRKLFETVWRDRAEKNDWKVTFEYGPAPENVTLRFERNTRQSSDGK